MTQINFRIEPELEEFLELRSKLEGKSKSTISKEIFLKGITTVMYPYLANLYRDGKISIKQIARLMKSDPSEVISQIASLLEDITIDDTLIDYSEKVGKKLEPLLQHAKKSGKTFKGTVNTEQK